MIEFKHLRSLQAIRHTGSLSKAAAAVHITQSALSHQFQEIEQRLGYRLFVRKSHPLRFTPQGLILLELADRIVPEVQRALQQCNQPEQFKINLAIECHSCIQWLIPALTLFAKNYPQVATDFKSNTTFDPQFALLQGELDLVITSDKQASNEFCYLPLFDFEVRLVVSPQHSLANKSQVLPQDLENETLLIYPVERQRLDVWQHFLKPHSVLPKFKNVDNTLLIIQMVSAGMGIAALPHWLVENVEQQQLITTKLLGHGLWRRLYAAVRAEDKDQPILRAFINSIIQHAGTKLNYIRMIEE